MKNLNLSHSQGPRGQPFGVETKNRISGKTRENVDDHIQLHEQEAIKYCVSHQFKDNSHHSTSILHLLLIQVLTI